MGEEEQGGRGGRSNEENKRDNDEIPFSSAEPVVALGLTPLRLTKTNGGVGIRNKETRTRREGGQKAEKRNSTGKDEEVQES